MGFIFPPHFWHMLWWKPLEDLSQIWLQINYESWNYIKHFPIFWLLVSAGDGFLAIQAQKSLNMANPSHSKFENVSQLLANFLSYKKVFIAGCNTVVVQRLLLWQHGVRNNWVIFIYYLFYFLGGSVMFGSKKIINNKLLFGIMYTK